MGHRESNVRPNHSLQNEGQLQKNLFQSSLSFQRPSKSV